MDELLDVLDEQGNPTGEIKSRRGIQKSGEWHKAAHVWIINSKGELLITRRSLNAVHRLELGRCRQEDM